LAWAEGGLGKVERLIKPANSIQLAIKTDSDHLVFKIMLGNPFFERSSVSSMVRINYTPHHSIAKPVWCYYFALNTFKLYLIILGAVFK
jgi:hypothetical protein